MMMRFVKDALNDVPVSTPCAERTLAKRMRSTYPGCPRGDFTTLISYFISHFRRLRAASVTIASLNASAILIT